jgi:hypothetical protein
VISCCVEGNKKRYASELLQLLRFGPMKFWELPNDKAVK